MDKLKVLLVNKEQDAELVTTRRVFMPQCLNCTIARRVDEITLYIPCRIKCIKTGESLVDVKEKLP